ncbi:Sorbitol dehydrogenase [Pirellulimonas nuda]|uniref:Sorbitol dehydrogenase n=1 Tax=Pirellulimonas nuda TaxID=2528009 RepID=A0A518D9P7_9BACT|nr:galactitol-1-phosphate 5-dehydrogenase [Pirellulimonas nuda]QDU88204.1 Sorbitol dehydrogenase [Pirellulimonas nuda]
MKALQLTEYRRLEMIEAPTPEIAADEALIRVSACGVCGSDVHGYDGSTGRRRPPLVMGHEAAGVVERIGAAVDGLAAGDRVTFDSTISCGECGYCRGGQINLCDNRQVLGVSCEDYRRHGAFAEFVAVPQRVLYKLPSELPMEHAALIEAVSVAVHAVARTPLQDEAATVVVGAGMIGLLVVQALRVAGAGQIIAVDIDADRLALAQKFGATHTILSRDRSPVDEVLSLTAGRGADASFEVVGATPTFNTAVNCVRKGGTVTLVGNVSPNVEAPLQAIVTRELTLYGSCASSGEYPRCIELMASGQIDVAPLISACVPLEEGPAWFERLYAREPGLMKVVLKP